MTTPEVRRDPRPLWLRLLVAGGIVVMLLIGLPLVALGLLAIGSVTGRDVLVIGLVASLSGVFAAARELAERRIVRRPPQPRLETSPDGEAALFLPRDPAPTRISSLALLGYAATAVLGAVFSLLERQWGWASVAAVLALWLAHQSAPHRSRTMAGGFWLTATRVGDDYRGIRWDTAWEDLTGVDARNRLRVLLAVRSDRVPTVRRSGPRGRAWNPVVAGNVLRVDSAHLAGGSALAGELVEKGLADPVWRRDLGTPTSLTSATGG